VIVPEKAPVFHFTPGPIVRLPSITNGLPPDAVQLHDPALLSTMRFPNVLPENAEAGVNTDEPRYTKLLANVSVLFDRGVEIPALVFWINVPPSLTTQRALPRTAQVPP
jgi:hypothetical protein